MPVEITDDIARLKNTHLMEWLPYGYNHCQRGSKDWCQGYLDSARQYIAALEAALTQVAEQPVAWRYEIDYEDLRGWQPHIWFTKPEPSPRVRNISPVYTRPSPPCDSRTETLEEAAKLIEAHIIQDTHDGKVLRPREEGNRDGLHYAAAIRALSEAGRSALKEEGGE